MTDRDRSVRFVALYLPQFHPVAENDKWWGPGFTEWRHVANAKPLFPGHRQPRVPADLGYYDLRVPETRNAQADLAKSAGIESFCYYHYWFGDRIILERPFQEVLKSGEPRHGFCLCWANESWSGIWHGQSQNILIRQNYGDTSEWDRHFYFVLPAFLDQRYTKVGGRPLFAVYRPQDLPKPQAFTDRWQELAIKEGLPGVHFVGMANHSKLKVPACFDAETRHNLAGATFDLRNPMVRMKRLLRSFSGRPRHVYGYADVLDDILNSLEINEDAYPCLIHDWDNSPRVGSRALILQGASPRLFAKVMRKAVAIVHRKPFDERIIFLKSWNEWAESNYLEPDLDFGHGYLEVIRQESLLHDKGLAESWAALMAAF